MALPEKDMLDIRLLKRSQLVAVEDDGSMTLNTKTDDGEPACKLHDTLIISMGWKANNALVVELQ